MLSSLVGNASRFLYGIQAKRVSFNCSCADVSDPQSAKRGLFSSGRRLFFAGVVAGTKQYRTRRWQTGGGREKVAQADYHESQALSSGSSGEMSTLLARQRATSEDLCVYRASVTHF